MIARFWGTRGSIPTPGEATARHGGNTSCVSVDVLPDHLVVLDAGTGIRDLNSRLPTELRRIDILLSHLHMDHIIGLGFFAGLFQRDLDVHIWGPASVTQSLQQRLHRYLSPPLFPVLLRDVPCDLTLHNVPEGTFELPGIEATSARVCHPGPTVGYRLTTGSGTLTYLSDHEPMLGSHEFPHHPDWMSGYDLAVHADVLIHDAQYTEAEYSSRVGWGHSTFAHAVDFAVACQVGHLVLFHHDPDHDDEFLDAAHAGVIDEAPMMVTSAMEGDSIEVGAHRSPTNEPVH